jgi:hypothetical protein
LKLTLVLVVLVVEDVGVASTVGHGPSGTVTVTLSVETDAPLIAAVISTLLVVDLVRAGLGLRPTQFVGLECRVASIEAVADLPSAATMKFVNTPVDVGEVPENVAVG